MLAGLGARELKLTDVIFGDLIGLKHKAVYSYMDQMYQMPILLTQADFHFVMRIILTFCLPKG